MHIADCFRVRESHIVILLVIYIYSNQIGIDQKVPLEISFLIGLDSKTASGLGEAPTYLTPTKTYVFFSPPLFFSPFSLYLLLLLSSSSPFLCFAPLLSFRSPFWSFFGRAFIHACVAARHGGLPQGYIWPRRSPGGRDADLVTLTTN